MFNRKQVSHGRKKGRGEKEGEKVGGGGRMGRREDRQAGSPLENKAIKRMRLRKTLGQNNQTRETLETVIDSLKAQWQS
jgi:dephospho-CoA kinase